MLATRLLAVLVCVVAVCEAGTRGMPGKGGKGKKPPPPPPPASKFGFITWDAQAIAWASWLAVVIGGGALILARDKKEKEEGLGAIKADLRALVKSTNCGPILIRLSWHDAGVYSTGQFKGGCPNAVMRFADSGEGAFGANAGLPTVAVGLLKDIAHKYVTQSKT